MAEGALQGLRVLDLSRILAGPTCTQILGDLGAEILKIERPGEGDDTRKWGPPFVTGPDGQSTEESAYYLSANRNKQSVALNFTTPRGKTLLLRLLEGCDILVENFKTGALARYGLDYETLRQKFPRLIYCSITGFGQTGPYRARPGYDYLAQAMGGVMSITGQADGPPTKVGVGIADVTTGLYATIGILAALRRRDETGEGQQVDVCLLDTQVSWLINEATNYLVSGQRPVRRGNDHPNIVPYRVYQTLDGHIVLAVGNDSQFVAWAQLANVAHLADDPAYATNPARVRNRDLVNQTVAAVMATRTSADWLAALEVAGVPAGPVNNIDEVFADPQVLARGMKITMGYAHSDSGSVDLVGSPLKLSGTPVSYRRPPPVAGEHTDDILVRFAGLSATELDALRAAGVIG